jgi:hypothetical protein
MPFLLLAALISLATPAVGAEVDVDVLDLVLPGVQYVKIEKPKAFRGTPLESSWRKHAFGGEFPLEAVDEVLSVFGKEKNAEEPFLYHVLRVDPIILRNKTRTADWIERYQGLEIYRSVDVDGNETVVVNGSLMIWGDRETVVPVVERITGQEPPALDEWVRSKLSALRERVDVCSWLKPTKNPKPADYQSIGEQIEDLVDEAYSTVRVSDGFVEMEEQFVTETAEDGPRLAALIRRVVEKGLKDSGEGGFGKVLLSYHRNFGDSAEVSSSGQSVKLYVRVSPEEFEKLQQEMPE